MGRFGLTVQAGILLGKSLRNLRETLTLPQSASRALQDDEAKVIEMALSALSKVSYDEAQQRRIGVCGLTKLCYRYAMTMKNSE
jgi:hypothetical protein